MTKFTPPKELQSLAPYRGGAASFGNKSKLVKLSSNESALGASPKAVRAFKKAADKKALAIYPEGTAALLREALAEKHGIASKQIICGCGSDDPLQLLTRVALYKGGEGLHTAFSFALYPTLIRANGGVPIAVAEENFRTSVDGILKKANQKTKILLLANPNNPTGTYLNFDELKFLRKKLPEHILLVLDAAYAEYVSNDNYDAGIRLVKKHSNVAMTRTFSKIYGLANLRLGWSFMSPALAETLNAIRLPFNVSTPALSAGLAALEDDAFVRRAQQHNQKWLAKMKQELAPLLATDSVANFLLLDFQSKQRAGKAFRFLAERGFLLRQMDEYNLSTYLRLSIGSTAANRKVLLLLQEFGAA